MEKGKRTDELYNAFAYRNGPCKANLYYQLSAFCNGFPETYNDIISVFRPYCSIPPHGMGARTTTSTCHWPDSMLYVHRRLQEDQE